jgi:hypothetical protein
MDHTCNQSERILTLELNQKSMAQDISEIKKDVKDLNIKFDEFIDKLDKKFADKRVELAMKWAIGIICGIVVAAIVNGIVVK